MDLDELATLARAALPGLLVALDFDGTLAPIVPDPADSRPLPGTVAALQALTGLGARVAVITGRDAETVLRLSGFAAVPGLVVEGLYGAETWTAGALRSPREPSWMPALRTRLPQLLAAHSRDPRVWIEDKRLSLVVHGRLADDPEAALDPLRGPVQALAEELGLEFHPGRGVLELRLPGFDKAGALRRVVGEHRPSGVLFAGDDVGDLPAFELIRTLRAEGAAAWSVAVTSPDVPEVAAAADVPAGSPAAVLALLQAIARQPPG